MAGFIIAFGGTEAAFYVAGAGFLVLVAATYGLRIPRITRTASGGAAHDLLEGLNYISKNSVFSFLIALTFFNSFFASAGLGSFKLATVEEAEQNMHELK